MSLELQLVAVAASAVGTIISAVLSLFAKRSHLILATNERSPERDLKSETRFLEIESMLSDENQRKRLYRYASALLVFAQFVVGGLLASSVIAKNLSETLVSILGLVVLASSLVSQHFRPDLLYKLTAQKIYQLQSLKRWVEDEIYELSKSPLDENKLLHIRKHVTTILGRIEQTELEFLETNYENKPKA